MRTKANRKGIQKKCSSCNSIFVADFFNDQKGYGKYCSRACYAHYLMGKTTTENQKKIARENWLGSKNPRWNGGIKKPYRVRKKEAPGWHSKEEWEELKLKYFGMCLCCKRQEPFIKLSEDHIIPLILGGSDSIENIQPLCLDCNKRKARKVVDYTLTLT